MTKQLQRLLNKAKKKLSKPPKTQELRYRKELLGYTKALQKHLRQAFKDNNLDAQKIIQEVLDPLLVSVENFVSASLTDTLVATASGVSDFNKAKYASPILEAVGLEPVPVATVEKVLGYWVEQNVNLVTKATTDQLRDLKRIMLDQLASPNTKKSLASEIAHIFGVGRSRSLLIATDQILKLNGTLDRQKQEHNGISEYIWRTSQDIRVRPAHRERNGKRFKWSKPPADGHPSEAVRCRCTAEPVLDAFFPPKG